ncbi:HD domain-containing phosphohydrolase [Vulcanococcus limneticus]|uniref:HD domain-containing phosphohydrolase n=1 Tax=Vulcanococcus limneticus TaxID=2170428 RepID=UPI00398BC7BA
MHFAPPTSRIWRRLTGAGLSSGLGLALGLGLIGGLACWQGFRQNRERSDRREAEAWLRRQASGLQPRFIAAQVISESLAASIVLNPRLTIDGFYRFAEQALNQQRDVLALQLSPGGSIAAQYPYQGGPQIGLNLLTSPTNRRTSQLALQRRTSVSQGPFPLVQGGQGLVIRTPIFLAGSQRFWGFSGILLDWEALTADLGENARAGGFDSQLRVVDSSGRVQESPGFAALARSGAGSRLSLPLPGGQLTIAATRARPALERWGEEALVGLLGLVVTGGGTLALLNGNRSRFRALRDARRLRHATVKAMAIVASTHHDETGAHLERCARYAEVIGRQLQAEGLPISDADLDALTMAVPLHDIGKVGIPDAILKKPDRLTAEEQATMQLHPQIGFNILDLLSQDIDIHDRRVFEMAKDLALSHHENWDGSGYPQGLSGESIPLVARIMAILDVYDGLASKRCYKEALPHGEVVDTVVALAGTKFDPSLVEEFLKVSEQFRQIFEATPDSQSSGPQGQRTPVAAIPQGPAS